MAIHEYKVTLRRPFKSDTVTAVVHAHHAEDACTQARVHFSNDGELYVAEVQPTAPSHEDDPDRIRVNFRKDLADAAPPMGTQETERLRKECNQLKELVNIYRGNLENAVPQKDLDDLRKLKDMELEVLRNADTSAEPLKTLCTAIQGNPQVGPRSDVFMGAMNEIERLRKVDKDFPSYKDAVALRDKFEEALHVVECAESMLGHRADNAAINTAERGALREYVGRFRTLHPKPGP